MKNVVSMAGVALIILGTLALVYQGISYTTQEQVADLGIVEIRENNTETIPLPPIVGGVVLLLGVGLVFVGSRQSS